MADSEGGPKTPPSDEADKGQEQDEGKWQGIDHVINIAIELNEEFGLSLDELPWVGGHDSNEEGESS